MKLLSKDTSNAKLAKTHAKFGRPSDSSLAKPWDTYILYLAPATVAYDSLSRPERDVMNVVNVCPASTPECRAGCLFYAGQAQVFKNINEARKRKTLMFIQSRSEFLEQLRKDLRLCLKRAAKTGHRVAVRLNGTSDIDWVALGIIGDPEFSAIQFYDYTKLPTRAVQWAQGKLPPNYHITFSRSGTNAVAASRVLALGGNVAVVYDHKLKLSTEYIEAAGHIDGDTHDARFLDGKAEQGKLVLLKAKGTARNTASESGFVLNGVGLSKLLQMTAGNANVTNIEVA